MLKRLHFDNREDWLKARKGTLGASQAAAAVGLSKWQTNIALWEQCAGIGDKKDLTSPAMEFGTEAEAPIRELFAMKRTELQVIHHPFDILYLDELPWLRATLDGEIKVGDKNGILEIKTAQANTKAQWSEWDKRIPEQYYCQILTQLLATDFNFVTVFALIKGQSDWTLREYHFERSEVAEDMNWLLERLKTFWGFVERKEKPPLLLTI